MTKESFARQSMTTASALIDKDYPFIKEVFDEMFLNQGQFRPEYQAMQSFFKSMADSEIKKRALHAHAAFLTKGVTYTVYGDEGGTEKIMPFDIMPRIISAEDWQHISSGLNQRIRALNAFLHDVYHECLILRDGVIPAYLVSQNPCYRKEAIGVSVPGKSYITISGIDIIRDTNGRYLVLEDNLRCPSGVSYVLENRDVMQRIMPELFNFYPVEPVSLYPRDLLSTLSSLMPESNPNVVLLTPGVYNSAYYEHAFLAANMGINLVEGSDLVVHNKKVYMKTTCGLEQVHVIYRRIDEDYLDPQVFRPDSTLGVPGLFDCYREGSVAIANAIGTGVADDKSVYAYVPLMIQYYLKEKPILPNIDTYLLSDPASRKTVFDNIREMVIKPTGGSGGYDILMGSTASDQDIKSYINKVGENPGAYIAQRIVKFSSHPTYVNESGSLQPRHIDLRPFVLMGANGRIKILPGGLSRVALKQGSLIVNSSQGGGGKDTWVLSGTNRV